MSDGSLKDPTAPWLIVTGDFVRTGGMDVANYMLARYLAEQGHEVHLVAYRVADDLLAAPNVSYHRVPKPLNSYTLGAPLLDRYGRFWAKRIATRGGRVVVNGGSCNWGDINWAHYVHAAYKPIKHHNLPRRLLAQGRHAQFLSQELRGFGCARVVVANSNRTKQDIIERLGVSGSRVQVVYYGSDPQAFTPATEQEKQQAKTDLGWSTNWRAKAVFVGALGDDRKGFDVLFDAWTQLCADPGWDLDLVVVGSGSALPQWKARASQTPVVRDRIEFLGFRSDVAKILRAADLLVAPTRYEAYGLGVHEALCCGIPAVVSRGAGVAERFPEIMHPLLLNDVSAELVAERLRTWRTCPLHWAKAASALGTLLRSEAWERQMRAFVQASADAND